MTFNYVELLRAKNLNPRFFREILPIAIAILSFTIVGISLKGLEQKFFPTSANVWAIAAKLFAQGLFA
ncbi:hypothetical protein [Calothrix sp. NIES-2100]|uniref:hypothetical protein n=1 Tax=Calothrix sp. NIES-2100 TaxID=1954172 RepID=UPI000BBBD3FB